jgi:hypothetical protein
MKMRAFARENRATRNHRPRQKLVVAYEKIDAPDLRFDPTRSDAATGA